MESEILQVPLARPYNMYDGVEVLAEIGTEGNISMPFRVIQIKMKRLGVFWLSYNMEKVPGHPSTANKY